MEIELKYQIDNAALADKIMDDAHIMKISDADTLEVIPMHAVYFDTEDRSLNKAEVAFRIRKEGDVLVGTLKWSGGAEDGMHRREEINAPVTDDEMLKEPDISIFEQSDAYDMMKNLVGDAKLIPIMDIYVTRKQVRVDTGKSICELSVDLGEVSCCGKSAPISELEIELYSGEEEDMAKLGAELCEKYNLTPSNISKYKRGLDLCK